MGAWLSENTNVCWLLPLSKNTSQPLSFNLLSAATNLLHEIDQATQAVMEAVAKAQELRPGSSAGVVEFGPGVPALRLDRAVGFGDACVRSYYCTVPALPNACLTIKTPLLRSSQVPIVELRRHRRAFLRLVTNLSMTRAPDAATARRMFVDFLASQLAHA